LKGILIFLLLLLFFPVIVSFPCKYIVFWGHPCMLRQTAAVSDVCVD